MMNSISTTVAERQRSSTSPSQMTLLWKLVLKSKTELNRCYELILKYIFYLYNK